MKPEEWLGIAARGLGLYWLVSGLGYLLDALLLNLGYFNYPDPTPAYYVINGLFQAIVGLYFLRGAPLLVGFAYPLPEEDAEGENEGPEPPKPTQGSVEA